MKIIQTTGIYRNAAAIFTCCALLAPVMTLPACAQTGAQPQEKSVTPQADLEGLSERFNPKAQRLFARARVMWDIHEKCSDPDLAIEYLDVAVAMEPEYADAYMRRALAASELLRWDAAFLDSSRAIRLDPKPDNYACRALIFTRQGNYLGARKDLGKALLLEPGNIKAKTFLRELDARKSRQPRQ